MNQRVSEFVNDEDNPLRRGVLCVRPVSMMSLECRVQNGTPPRRAKFFSPLSSPQPSVPACCPY